MRNAIGAKEDLREFLAATANDESGNPLYFVVGSSLQMRNPEAIKLQGTQMVQCFITGGTMPQNGKTSHTSDITVKSTARIAITVVTTAKLDLSVLDDPLSTPEQISTAIAGTIDAEDEADTVFDNIVSHLFNNVMGADGEYFGREDNIYSISNRWGDDWQKGSTEKKGSTIVLHGYFDIDFNSDEIPNGDEPTPGGVLDGKINIQNGDGDPLAVRNG